MNPFSLEGKTIFVTGASSGIGRACALAVAGAGAQVIVSGRDESRLQETLKQLSGNGHSAIRADLTKAEEIKNIASQLPLLDGAVFAAGINKIKPAKFLSESDIDEMINTNFKGTFFLVCALLKAKKLKDSSSCIFIGSIASRFSAVGNTVYSASKGALLSGVRSLALETARQKIRMNVISPGQVVTPLMENTAGAVLSEVFAKNEALYPLGYGKPEDVAGGCVYLLSDGARWVTGHDFVMDGGFTLT